MEVFSDHFEGRFGMAALTIPIQAKARYQKVLQRANTACTMI